MDAPPPDRIRCGKKPYANRRDAERECQAMRRKHRDPGLQTYYCRLCRAHHFGHRPRRLL
jgi:hypothetical protein